MSLKKFIDFNKICPKCGNQLSLYLGTNTKFIKAIHDMDGGYIFAENDDCKNFNKIKSEDDVNFTVSYEEKEDISYYSSKDSLLESDIIFFYICNCDAINATKWDYSINVYDACYYRGSQKFSIKNIDGENILKLHENSKDVINHEESFCFDIMKNNVEYVYFLSLKYVGQKTVLWHYTVNEEQAKDEYYNPNIFEKELPLLTNRPDFSNSDKMIERFDSWIIMS